MEHFWDISEDNLANVAIMIHAGKYNGKKQHRQMNSPLPHYDLLCIA